jgi:DNA polymerase-3 subunit epsilon
MIRKYDKLLAKLIKRKKMSKKDFFWYLQGIDNFYDNLELEYQLLLSNGMPLTEDEEHNIILKTANTKIEDEVFCIVDIETNANTPKKGQIIEIGAVKVQNYEIIDSYQSLVYANEVSEVIANLTGINVDMLQDAPPLKEVLEEFKIFLDDSVFVAHNVNFDYNFISKSLEQYELGVLLNRYFCSIDLSKRVINAYRYGLDHLKEVLDIKIGHHHRAYDDALSTVEILNYCIERLDTDIVTTEDLIAFSKSDNIVGYSIDFSLTI